MKLCCRCLDHRLRSDIFQLASLLLGIGYLVLNDGVDAMNHATEIITNYGSNVSDNGFRNISLFDQGG